MQSQHRGLRNSEVSDGWQVLQKLLGHLTCQVVVQDLAVLQGCRLLAVEGLLAKIPEGLLSGE